MITKLLSDSFLPHPGLQLGNYYKALKMPDAPPRFTVKWSYAETPSFNFTIRELYFFITLATYNEICVHVYMNEVRKKWYHSDICFRTNHIGKYMSLRSHSFLHFCIRCHSQLRMQSKVYRCISCTKYELWGIVVTGERFSWAHYSRITKTEFCTSDTRPLPLYWINAFHFLRQSVYYIIGHKRRHGIA